MPKGWRWKWSMEGAEEVLKRQGTKSLRVVSIQTLYPMKETGGLCSHFPFLHHQKGLRIFRKALLTSQLFLHTLSDGVPLFSSRLRFINSASTNYPPFLFVIIFRVFALYSAQVITTPERMSHRQIAPPKEESIEIGDGESSEQESSEREEQGEGNDFFAF